MECLLFPHTSSSSQSNLNKHSKKISTFHDPYATYLSHTDSSGTMKYLNHFSTALLSLLIHSAKANFHVSVIDGKNIRACASDTWDCGCYINGHGAGIIPGSGGIGDFFYVEAGLCGLPQLNFYKQGDGSYDFYVNDGDGQLQGTCYSNTAELFCGSQVVDDQLVCYSYICNN